MQLRLPAVLHEIGVAQFGLPCAHTVYNVSCQDGAHIQLYSLTAGKFVYAHGGGLTASLPAAASHPYFKVHRTAAGGLQLSLSSDSTLWSATTRNSLLLGKSGEVTKASTVFTIKQACQHLHTVPWNECGPNDIHGTTFSWFLNVKPAVQCQLCACARLSWLLFTAGAGQQ